MDDTDSGKPGKPGKIREKNSLWKTQGKIREKWSYSGKMKILPSTCQNYQKLFQISSISKKIRLRRAITQLK